MRRRSSEGVDMSAPTSAATGVKSKRRHECQSSGRTSSSPAPRTGRRAGAAPKPVCVEKPIAMD